MKKGGIFSTLSASGKHKPQSSKIFITFGKRKIRIGKSIPYFLFIDAANVKNYLYFCKN